MTKDRIKDEGLQHVVPTRKKETGRNITVAYLCNRENDNKWNTPRAPGVRQKKKKKDAGTRNRGRGQDVHVKPCVQYG